MNATYVRIELARQFRDISTWMFVIALPAGMLLIFGQMGYADESAGHGNVRFYLMVSMAAFSATTAATAIAGIAATESMLGWGRQLSLTRQTTLGFVLNKAIVAIIVAAGAVAVVFTVGALSGARGDTWQVWVHSALITLAGSSVFAVYGLAVALWFKSETAAGMAGATITFFGFLGNVFVPLGGGLLAFARFTPMYGYVGLVRYPLTEGRLVDQNTPTTDSVWALVANVVAWLAIFSTCAALGLRRARARR